ncbi:hypothetical protein MOF23_07110 [Bacillus inaquosorum]|uniref:hypothetical protein n=1 Tax=Bacillus inaquosorum TaxID=483913 RepID=UPI00228313CC|nr:hypothetical protein [Bacillus inaquosorum]MCY9308745.1 hypothetical protein [Bacillus inaquosorum]
MHASSQRVLLVTVEEDGAAKILQRDKTFMIVPKERVQVKGKKNKLSYAEETELRYLRLKGFRYLVRNEIGSVEVYVNKPHRDKETNYYPYGKDRGGYDHWIETKTPISLEEQSRRSYVDLGNYEFITWKDEPKLIDNLLA